MMHLVLITSSTTAFPQLSVTALREPPEVKFDVGIQSTTFNGFMPVQHCDQHLKANFTTVVKNNKNLASPSLVLQINDGLYSRAAFVITSVDGVAQPASSNSRIGKIAPNATKTITGYILLGDNQNGTFNSFVFSASVELDPDNEVNFNFSESDNLNNTQTFTVDARGQTLPEYKFCDCLPPNVILFDTSKTYLLKAYLFVGDMIFGQVNRRWIDFPVFEVEGDPNLHIENNSYTQQHYENAIVKLKLRRPRTRGELPAYQIVFPDGRYLTLGLGLALTTEPNIYSYFVFDPSVPGVQPQSGLPDYHRNYPNYHIYQRNLCVALETKQRNHLDLTIPPALSFNSRFSSDWNQLFILKPLQ